MQRLREESMESTLRTVKSGGTCTELLIPNAGPFVAAFKLAARVGTNSLVPVMLACPSRRMCSESSDSAAQQHPLNILLPRKRRAPLLPKLPRKHYRRQRAAQAMSPPEPAEEAKMA
mmetsp:Transcript_109366/g.305924  ORF Transcript_109366/g.305924 Transcript_109366/m.305924 type:complete len:117 (-) Transcript_109366:3-353(-)